MSSPAQRPEAPPAPKTIPALPCVSLDDALAFWTAIGFTVTYIQRAPNPYGVVARDGYELHLFGLKGIKPDEIVRRLGELIPRDPNESTWQDPAWGRK